MKNSILLFIVYMAIVLSGCQKEEFIATENNSLPEKGENALKYDYEIDQKRKTLEAEKHNGHNNLDGRFNHTSVVFDNKIWIMGGTEDYYAVGKNDVMYSSDGIGWEVATFAASFSPRQGHASVVFKNKIWVVGGMEDDPDDHDEQYDEKHDHEEDDEYSELNDVWSSSDGINWNLETANADFAPRKGHALTVWNGSLWLIGGMSRDIMFEDCCHFTNVWRSQDGINWEKVTDNAFYSGFSFIGHAATVFDNKLWVAGVNETGKDGIWYSLNGSDWEVAADSPAFFNRIGHTFLTYDEKLWIIAGFGNINGNASDYLNDIWYSADGVNWSEAESSIDFPKRSGHSSVVFQNKMWVINGVSKSDKIDGYASKNGDGYYALSDVWSLQDPNCCEIDDITFDSN